MGPANGAQADSQSQSDQPGRARVARRHRPFVHGRVSWLMAPDSLGDQSGLGSKDGRQSLSAEPGEPCADQRKRGTEMLGD